jgi:PAS domain S-box-containing protein
MSDPSSDFSTLKEAFEAFTRSTQILEESYRKLESRVRDLDRELAAKNQQLALTSDYLQSLLESISDGVIAVDTEGLVTTFNQAANRVLGFAAAEVVGRPFNDVFGRGFSALPGRQVMELRAQNGKLVPVTERDSPISDRAHRRIGAVKVFQDLSEIESLRAQVRQKDQLATLGEMAATVAHEIRNPLGGIRGFATLLARDLEPNDPRRRLVEKILLGTRELDGVVMDLLEYTRPVQLRLRPTHCADLIEAALGYLDLDGRPIAIVNGTEPAARVLVDPDKMRQALLNILLNAVQSIEAKGEVRIRTEVEPDSVSIAITDTGCGMTPEQVQEAFSPFFTTKEKGTGLGLSVAAKIVTGHGGSLSVESQVGRGSTFRVHLPKAE